MKTSTAFRLAKASLWDGEGDIDTMREFVCIAAGPGKAGRVVKTIIRDLIAPCITLEGWLSDRVEENVYGNPRRMQITRHAWLDHLISHYESIGD